MSCASRHCLPPRGRPPYCGHETHPTRADARRLKLTLLGAFSPYIRCARCITVRDSDRDHRAPGSPSSGARVRPLPPRLEGHGRVGVWRGRIRLARRFSPARGNRGKPSLSRSEPIVAFASEEQIGTAPSTRRSRPRCSAATAAGRWPVESDEDPSAAQRHRESGYIRVPLSLTRVRRDGRAMSVLGPAGAVWVALGLFAHFGLTRRESCIAGRKRPKTRERTLTATALAVCRMGCVWKLRRSPKRGCGSTLQASCLGRSLAHVGRESPCASAVTVSLGCLESPEFGSIPPEEGFAPSASRRSLTFTRREHTMSFSLGERGARPRGERGWAPARPPQRDQL
jgi:hypothetical protein